MTKTDLFGQPEEVKQGGRVVEWRIATNHLNLFFMLGSGMILPSNAFGDKYYEDSLSVLPGWVPLFQRGPSPGLIELCCREADHLIPCVVILNLSRLSGPVLLWSADDSLQRIRFEDAVFEKEDRLLVPAPLPLTLIERVEMRDAQQKKALLDSARDLRNVDLGTVDLRVRKASFKPATTKEWPLVPLNVEQRKISMAECGAVGGFLALSAKLADRSSKLCQISSFLYGERHEDSSAFDELVESTGRWMQKGSPDLQMGQSVQLLWGLHDSISSCGLANDVAMTRDAVVHFLEQALGNMDEKAKRATAKLVEQLKEIERLPDKSSTDILSAHGKLLSRALVCLFLNDDVVDLLELSDDHISDEELLLSGLLMTASKRWIDLPADLRSIPGLQAAVSHRMAEFAHQSSDSGIAIGEPPSRPLSLREAFSPGKMGLSKPQKAVAVMIAKEMGWDIVQTHIRLPKGRYDTQVTSSGLHITVPGEVDFVELVVDEIDLLAKIGKTLLPASLQSDARTRLKV